MWRHQHDRGALQPRPRAVLAAAAAAAAALALALLALLLLLPARACGGVPSAAAAPAGAPAVCARDADKIPASGNGTDLNELTFAGRVSDGRVWFVELYMDSCRGCRRVAGHVSMLADALADGSHAHIVVARLDCGGSPAAERFCDQALRVTRTPSFRVYYAGKQAIEYKAEFYFIDLMMPFITGVAADLKGFSLPSRAPRAPLPSAVDEEEDEDDEYE